MTEPCITLDYASAENLMVIDAYLQRAQAAKAADAEFTGWLERLDAIGDLTREQLTRVHGELIAAGYLKFEIGSSNVGLRYQVSPRGRQTLDKYRRLAEETEQENASAAESHDSNSSDDPMMLDEAA